MTHTNGVVETWANDPNGMRRPGSIAATGPAAAWSSGAYVYDGKGNITKIGFAWYTYDKVNRLTAGHVYTVRWERGQEPSKATPTIASET